MAESVQFALQLRPASSNIHQVVKALCLGSSTRPPQSLYGVGSNPTLLKLFCFCLVVEECGVRSQ
jgi:hypothetical protein